MFVLGLLILAAAVVLAVEFVLANHSQITFKLWNQSWTMDAFWLGVMGAAFLLAVVVAMMLMRGSMARSLRMRAERRELAAENRRLAAGAKHSAPAAPTSRKDHPAAPAYALPAQTAGAPQAAGAAQAPGATQTYPTVPPTGGPGTDGRQVAYSGAPAPAEAEGNGKHRRFFNRHSDR